MFHCPITRKKVPFNELLKKKIIFTNEPVLTLHHFNAHFRFWLIFM